MSIRFEVDSKTELKVRDMAKKYPQLLNGYIISMARKTAYTKRAYVRYVCKFLDYISGKLNITITDGSELKDIKPMVIDEYMQYIRFTESGKEKTAMYRAAQLAAINGLFVFLVKNEIIKYNPCNAVEVPKDNKEHEIITMEQTDIDQMLKNIDNGIGTYKFYQAQRRWRKRDKLILILGITTGLRVSAIVGIDVNDINFEERYIKVTEKGNVEKRVYIGDRTVDALIQWIDQRKSLASPNENAVFICNGGKRMSVRTMENIIKNLSGGKFTPHKMRATCATKLYEATGDIYRVQQQLGHKSIKNTERYAKVSESKKKESANILDAIF